MLAKVLDPFSVTVAMVLGLWQAQSTGLPCGRKEVRYVNRRPQFYAAQCKSPWWTRSMSCPFWIDLHGQEFSRRNSTSPSTQCDSKQLYIARVYYAAFTLAIIRAVPGKFRALSRTPLTPRISFLTASIASSLVFFMLWSDPYMLS